MWRLPLAVPALVVFDVLVALGGFRSVHAVTRAMPVIPWGRLFPNALASVCWTVDEACIWYFRPVMCLQRACVTTWLLRLFGVEARAVIGYHPAPLASHAWVEVGGRIVNDRPGYARMFTVLDRL